MMTPTPFAFFDFDDTLAKGDSIFPYLLYCIKRGYAPKIQLFKAAAGFLRWKIQPSSGRAVKEWTLSYIKGRTVEEMDELARDFFRDVQQNAFFEDAAPELFRLRELGAQIIIVSASSDLYMKVLPEFLPIDAVISTTCEVADGRYTGKIGKNCKGEEKVRRIQEWLKERNLSIDKEHSAGYGDSPSDAPMLLLTASPNLVNPKGKLVKAIPDGRILHWH
ncbi:MAG: HAD-IB family hydrolase [Clostridiales bacterium]|nr:HAD-IB family hydrolase [Clostridiales bacterium]